MTLTVISVGLLGITYIVRPAGQMKKEKSLTEKHMEEINRKVDEQRASIIGSVGKKKSSSANV